MRARFLPSHIIVQLMRPERKLLVGGYQPHAYAHGPTSFELQST